MRNGDFNMAILRKIYSTKTARLHEDYLDYVKSNEKQKQKPLPFNVWAGTVGQKKKETKPVKSAEPQIPPYIPQMTTQTVKEIRLAREKARAQSRRGR